jgi:hypothetical protein
MLTLADIERVRQFEQEIAAQACDLLETHKAGARYGVIIRALRSQLEFWSAEARATRSPPWGCLQ